MNMKLCKAVMQAIRKRREEDMNNKLEVIGIDHGWSMMKTISQVFVTGVKEITTTPALFGYVLEYVDESQKATILTYFYLEVTVEKMSSYRQKQ